MSRGPHPPRDGACFALTGPSFRTGAPAAVQSEHGRLSAAHVARGAGLAHLGGRQHAVLDAVRGQPRTERHRAGSQGDFRQVRAPGGVQKQPRPRPAGECCLGSQPVTRHRTAVAGHRLTTLLHRLMD